MEKAKSTKSKRVWVKSKEDMSVEDARRVLGKYKTLAKAFAEFDKTNS